MKWEPKISDLEVLSAYDEPLVVDDVPRLERLAAATGHHVNVVFAAMERCERKGFLDCGMCIQGGWLTDAGIERLRQLREEKAGD